MSTPPPPATPPLAAPPPPPSSPGAAASSPKVSRPRARLRTWVSARRSSDAFAAAAATCMSSGSCGRGGGDAAATCVSSGSCGDTGVGSVEGVEFRLSLAPKPRCGRGVADAWGCRRSMHWCEISLDLMFKGGSEGVGQREREARTK
eukprot:360120-Chlamydomonas_euryale.AAC.1